MTTPDRSNFHLEQICINPTNRCNARCTYCFTDHNDTDMDLQTAKDAVKFLWEQRNPDYISLCVDGTTKIHQVFINWFGGEPMLVFDEIIKPTMLWAEEQGYDIGWGISTNCTLLTPERVEFFKHFQTGLLFSIDGIEEVQNDQRPLVGGHPSWPLIKDKLQMLANYEYGSVFRSTVPPRNIDKLTEGYCLARKYGFSRYYCGLVYEDPTWNQKYFDKFLEQAFAMSCIMYDDIVNYGDCTVIQPLVAAMRDQFLEAKINYSEHRCGLGTNTCGISPEGYIYGCQEHSTYNGKDDIFLIGDIYNGIDIEKRNKLLNAYLEGLAKNENNPKCADCRFKNDCYIENCPSVTLRSSGNFGGVFDTFCTWREVWDKCATLILQKAAIDGNTDFLRIIEEEMIGKNEEVA